jgi:hypothetical protein
MGAFYSALGALAAALAAEYVIREGKDCVRSLLLDRTGFVV